MNIVPVNRMDLRIWLATAKYFGARLMLVKVVSQDGM
jgi:hypothetical protein